MSKPEKQPQPAEKDPKGDSSVDPPEASPAPPEEEPTSQPDGYHSGV